MPDTYTHTQIIDPEEIRAVIHETFSEDHNLFKTYHVINDNEDLAINDTFIKVQEMINNYSAEFYKISLNGATIGYINVSTLINALHSFGLNVNYRTKDTKDYLIETIDDLFEGGIIYCTLYSKNVRAIDFLINNGYAQEPIVTLIKNKR